MANFMCVSCKQRKKEENFSANTLQTNSPVCAGCDVKALMTRLELAKSTLHSVKREQQAVVNVTQAVEEIVVKKPSGNKSLTILKAALARA